MPYYDTRSLMALKLDAWAPEPALRAFEIEREIAAQRERGQQDGWLRRMLERLLTPRRARPHRREGRV
ncbi:hypothetical protein AB9K41_28515 [Cribrihabitans sp. XS_ASV171]